MTAEPDLAIRAGRLDDAPAIVELLDELEHPAPLAVVETRLAEMASMDACRLLVAVERGAVVGMGTLQLTPVVHEASPVGRITTMIVADRCRGRGIGRSLVAAIESLAREAGCARIEVTSNNRRVRAHAFYEGLGYEPTSRRFVKRLESRG